MHQPGGRRDSQAVGAKSRTHRLSADAVYRSSLGDNRLCCGRPASRAWGRREKLLCDVRPPSFRQTPSLADSRSNYHRPNNGVRALPAACDKARYLAAKRSRVLNLPSHDTARTLHPPGQVTPSPLNVRLIMEEPSGRPGRSFVSGSRRAGLMLPSACGRPAVESTTSQAPRGHV